MTFRGVPSNAAKTIFPGANARANQERKLFICHGDEDVSLAFAGELQSEGWRTVVPRYRDRFELD